MKQYKRILFHCAALLFTVLCSTQAQTKAVPDDPAVPHFIELGSTAGGTLTGMASVEGANINLTVGKNFDLPHATNVALTAIPETGKQLSRVTKIGADGKEIDLGLSNLPTSTAYTFNYILEQSVILKAHFASQVRNINWRLEHLTSTNQPTNIEYGGRFDFTLIPDPGYLLPEKIDLGHLEEGKEFSYNPVNGEVKILIDMEYALTITAKAVRNITASMKWNSFTGRYFETGKTCTADYGIQANDRETPLLFRYIISDYETWKGSLEMKYADNYEMSNPRSFNFSDNGEVDILSTDCKSLPDAYNTYFSFTSTKAGKLLFKVEVYDEAGSHLYATLENGRILFADPVDFAVNPEVKGKVNEDIGFNITIGGLGFLSSEGEGRLGFNIYGDLKVEDITLRYGNNQIIFQEKGGIIYGSTPITSLKNEQPYSFTLNSRVPLTEENKIELWLSDSYYQLPHKEGNYISPDVRDLFTIEELAGGNLELDIPEKEIQGGKPLEVKLQVTNQEAYRLPSRIVVRMGNRILVPNADYSYNQLNGSITINKVDGNIVIEAIAIGIDQVEVFYNLTGIDISPSEATMSKDQALDFMLTAKTNYELPSSIKVEIDGTTLVVGTGYSYEAGKLRIQAESLEGAKALEIFAEGKWIKPEEPDQPVILCNVVLPELTGATTEPTAGTHQVKPGSDFSFRIFLDQEYDQSIPIVKANGQIIEPEGNSYYTIRVNGDLTISITGIVKNTNVGNTEIESNTLKVWGSNGILHIQSAYASTAYIVTFGGQLYKAITLPIGETVITVPQGSYIIHVGNQSYKIRF